jgi:uncharacterized protein
MADSPNVSVVRRLYEAHGNPEEIAQVLANQIRWEVVEGFPYSGTYEGLEAVLRDFFGRLMGDFDNWVSEPKEFIETGDRVVVLGYYSGKAQKTGKTFSAKFSHVWTLQDGKIVRLQQCADTVQLTHALEA